MATPETTALLTQKITTPDQMMGIYKAIDFINEGLPGLESTENLAYKLYERNGYDIPAYRVMNEEHFWKIRELLRQELGVYKPVEIWGHSINLSNNIGRNKHFLHTSSRDPKLIAYTNNNDTAVQDIQIVSKLGKYLTAYHSDRLTANTINNLASLYGADKRPFNLHWAQGAEDIVRVYRDCATQSCMSKEVDYWPHLISKETGEKQHPVETYDSPDIGVAYVTDEQERIVARALVNKLTSQYIRIYGNSDAMMRLLREQNIRVAGSLEGARLKRIELKNGEIVCPYLDGPLQRVVDKGDFLVVSQDGVAHATYSRASLRFPKPCPLCGAIGNNRILITDLATTLEQHYCYDCVISDTSVIYFLDEDTASPNTWTPGDLSRVKVLRSTTEEHYGGALFADALGQQYQPLTTEQIDEYFTFVDAYNKTGYIPNGAVQHVWRMTSDGDKELVPTVQGQMFSVRPVVSQDDNGYDPRQAEDGLFKDELIQSSYTHDWIQRGREVRAIINVRGHKATLDKSQCFLDRSTGTYYGKHYARRRLSWDRTYQEDSAAEFYPAAEIENVHAHWNHRDAFFVPATPAAAAA